jgi:hypothetical protein
MPCKLNEPMTSRICTLAACLILLSACGKTAKAENPPTIADVEANMKQGLGARVSALNCKREADDLFNCDFVVTNPDDKDATPVPLSMKFELLQGGKWRGNMTR